ncbi:MAG: APC family permease [Alicyclobacillus sp.]|nr:APC family permease [Alicyclobacillus sp.]
MSADIEMEVTTRINLNKVRRLQAKVLGFPEVLFQSITNMAPAAAIAYDIPLQSSPSAAGVSVAFANVMALVACLLIASTVIQFSRKLPSAGGFLTYVSGGLGGRAGFMSAWMFFVYAMVLPSEVTIIWSSITQDIVKQYLGINVSWILWELLIITLVAFLSYTGIQRSAKAGLFLGLFEVVVFIALGASLLIHPATPLSVKPFLPGSASAGLGGIFGFGLVYGILNFVGFEGAAPLAEESREPRKTVPRAVFTSTLILGLIYIFVSYASVQGWGFSRLNAFASAPSPYTTLATKVWGWGWIFVYLAMTNSSLACSLAAFNSSTRVLYSAGRVGVLPEVFGEVHPRHMTPYRGVQLLYLLTISMTIVTGLIWGPQTAFSVLAVTLTIGAILVYGLGTVALPMFYMREHRTEFSWVSHGLLPVLAVILLIYVLYNTIFPIPTYPLNVPLTVVIVWGVLGIVLSLVVGRRQGHMLDRAREIFVDD